MNSDAMMRGCGPLPICIDVGTVLDQQFGFRQVVDAPHESGRARVVVCIRVSTLVEQELHVGGAAIERCVHERSGAGCAVQLGGGGIVRQGLAECCGVAVTKSGHQLGGARIGWSGWDFRGRGVGPNGALVNPGFDGCDLLRLEGAGGASGVQNGYR